MTIRASRFLASLLNRPQMIEPSAGAAIVAALAPGAHLDGWDGEGENDERTDRDYQVCDGVAIIPVVGELVHRGAFMGAMSGLTSYQALGDMVEDALTDPGVSAVMFDIDSPGGEAAGCLDFAEKLASLRGLKPMVASINQKATSAAYAIASAADRIVIGEDGHAGSIGVRTYHADISGALDQEGVKITHLYAGARKIDGAPDLPLSSEARAAIQTDIDAVYDRFCRIVAANRALTVEAVRGTEAAIYRGVDAVKVGLADSIATQEEVLMALQTKSAPNGARLSAQTGGAKLDAPEGEAFQPCPDCPTPDECMAAGQCAKQDMKPTGGDTPMGGGKPADKGGAGCATIVTTVETKTFDPVAVAGACHAAGYPELTAGLLKVGATPAQVQTRIEEAQAIAQMCDRARVSEMAGNLVKSGVSLDMARSQVFDVLAARDAATVTDTAHAGARPAKAAKALDPGAIYASLNGR